MGTGRERTWDWNKVRVSAANCQTLAEFIAAFLTNAGGDDYNLTPTLANGKTFFAPSSSWKMLLKDRISILSDIL